MIETFPARLEGDGMARALLIGVAANLTVGLLVERFASVPTSGVFAAFNPALLGVALVAAAAQPQRLAAPWLLSVRGLGLVSAAIGLDAIISAFAASTRFGLVVTFSETGAGVVLAVTAVGLSLRMMVWPDAAPVVSGALGMAAALHLAVGPTLFFAFRRSDLGALPIGVGLVATGLAIGSVAAAFAARRAAWQLWLPVVLLVLLAGGAVGEMAAAGDVFTSSFGGDPGSFPTIHPDQGVSGAQSVVRAVVPPVLVLVLVVATLSAVRRLYRDRTTVGAEVRRLRPVIGGVTIAAAVGSLALRWTDHQAALDHFGVSDGTGPLDWWSDVAVTGTVLLVVAPIAALALVGDPARTGLTRRSWNLVLVTSGLLAVGSIHGAFDVLRAGSPLVAAANRFWPAGPFVVVVSTVVFVVLLRQWRRPELPGS